MARETRRTGEREAAPASDHDASPPAERRARREGRPEGDHARDPDADIELSFEHDREERRAVRRTVARVVRREVAEGDDDVTRTLAEGRLWWGVLGPLFLLLLHQQLNYMLVPWACRHDSPWVLHVVSLVLIAATILTGLMALRLWRAAGGDWESQGEGPRPRSRFMAILGVADSALAALIIFCQWLPILYLTPCRGA